MIAPLNRQELIKPANLSKTNGRMQLGDPEIITEERMQIGSTIDALMIMTMVRISIAFYVNVFIICQHRSPFAARNCFYKIKAKCTCIANGTERFSFV